MFTTQGGAGGERGRGNLALARQRLPHARYQRFAPSLFNLCFYSALFRALFTENQVRRRSFVFIKVC